MSSFMQLQRSRISCNRRQHRNRVQVKWDMSFESRGTRVIFGRMRAWLRTQLERQIQDVPPELACCEFQCRVTRCDGLRFNNCQRRIAYAASVAVRSTSKSGNFPNLPSFEVSALTRLATPSTHVGLNGSGLPAFLPPTRVRRGRAIPFPPRQLS